VFQTAAAHIVGSLVSLPLLPDPVHRRDQGSSCGKNTSPAPPMVDLHYHQFNQVIYTHQILSWFRIVGALTLEEAKTLRHRAPSQSAMRRGQLLIISTREMICSITTCSCYFLSATGKPCPPSTSWDASVLAGSGVGAGNDSFQPFGKFPPEKPIAGG